MPSHKDIAALHGTLLPHNASMIQFSNKLIKMAESQRNNAKLNNLDVLSPNKQLGFIAMSILALTDQTNELLLFFNCIESYNTRQEHLKTSSGSIKKFFANKFPATLHDFYMEKIIIPLQQFMTIMIEPDIDMIKILKDTIAVEEIYKKMRMLCAKEVDHMVAQYSL
jgi:hypothetical protein